MQQRFGHDVNVDDFRVLLGPVSLESWQSYRATIQQFMQWLAGNGKTLLEADGREIATYVSYLQGDEHSPASSQYLRYAPSTVYCKVSVVRRLFNALYQRGLIRRNPAAQVLNSITRFLDIS